MMKRNHTRHCASAAIAAALALSSTPLLAQLAPAPTTVAPDPVPAFPTTSTPPPVQPTIVVPDIAPAPTMTAPEPTATTTTTATTTQTERAAPRARAAAPADPAPVAAEEELVPAAAPPVAEVTAEPVAPVAVAEPVADAAPADDSGALQVGLAVLAAIAALVLAIWGFVAIGRRKPVDRKAAAIIERPVVTPPAPEPLAAEPAAIAPQSAPVPIRTAAPAPSMTHTGAAVALPSKMPATFEERSALIDRMVAAKPDRANPFKSPIQRRHRAKLILQSLGADFSDREPWIDLSQYPANWPELARRNTAAA